MIGGEKRTQQEFKNEKYVGLMETAVIAINPTAEEYKDVLGMELKEDSKATEYLGTSKEDNNTTLRVDVWLEEVKNKNKFKVSFFLEDKERENKDGTKKQYINNIGSCSWAADVNDLPDWFKKGDYRRAKVGEEDLYTFLRCWLSGIDYKKDGAVLEVEWKKLMKGNVKDLKDQINGEFSGTVVALATIKTVEKDGDTKEYQAVFNKAFLPPYALDKFRLIDYTEDRITALKGKKSRDLKPHEKFILNVCGEYGSKDYYVLKELREYESAANFVASEKPIDHSDASY